MVMDEIIKDFLKRLDEYQTGVNPPDSDFIEEVNSITRNLLIECPNCKLPLLGIGSVQHIKYCDGIPILAKYRWKKKKKPIEETTMYKNKQCYKKTLIKALNIATTIEEYESICREGGMSPPTATHYLKEFNLKDLKDKEWKKWMRNRYWTTTNCGYCNTEFETRKNRLEKSANKQHYCTPECYSNNKINIAQTILEEKFEKMGAEWDKVKAHKLEHYKEYRRLVTAWAVYHLRLHNPEMFKEWKDPDNDYQLDHKWAVIHAFYRGIDPQLVSHIDNLQLLPQAENGSKNDKWIDEIIPDVLREASEQPIDLSRYNRLNPPYISRAAKPDSKCIHCDKEYFEHKSNADKPESYCGVTCEKKEWLTPDREKMLYDLLKERILSLDWETPSDITKYVMDVYKSNMIYGDKIIQKIFNSIWVDEYNLPIANIRGSLERQLVASNKHYSFPQSYSGPFILECVECGKVTETKWRNTLLRFHGIVQRKDNKVSYKDHCNICSIKKSNTGVARGGWTARNEKIKKEFGEKLSKWM